MSAARVSNAVFLDAPCRLDLGRTAGLRNVTLSNGCVRTEILLDKGANVRQFWHAPTQTPMLAETSDWHEQLAAYGANGRRGVNYCDYYEGGWQDVLPADARDERASSGMVGEAAIIPWDLTRTPGGSFNRLASSRTTVGVPPISRSVMSRRIRRATGCM